MSDAQGAGRMFPGTIGGQSRVAAPIDTQRHRHKTRTSSAAFEGIADPTVTPGITTQSGAVNEFGTRTNITFDNTSGTARLVIIAIHALDGTITAPAEGTIVLDQLSVEGDREFFQVIPMPSATVLTWTPSTATGAYSWQIIASGDGDLGDYSVDFDYGADPAPRFLSVDLDSGNDRLVGLMVSRGSTAWVPATVTAPVGFGQWVDQAGAAAFRWSFDQQPAGPTGNMAGTGPDGNRSWATLLVVINAITLGPEYPSGTSILQWQTVTTGNVLVAETVDGNATGFLCPSGQSWFVDADANLGGLHAPVDATLLLECRDPAGTLLDSDSDSVAVGGLSTLAVDVAFAPTGFFIVRAYLTLSAPHRLSGAGISGDYTPP